MKPKILLCCTIVLLIVVLLFPISSTRTISGGGEVLTAEKEKTGDCQLSIEVKEVSARFFSYSRRFSFVLDGAAFSEPALSAYSDTWDEFCSITHVYYDGEKSRINHCTLVYPEDLVYAVLRWNDKLYFVNTGPEIPYSALPVS